MARGSTPRRHASRPAADRSSTARMRCRAEAGSSSAWIRKAPCSRSSLRAADRHPVAVDAGRPASPPAGGLPFAVEGGEVLVRELDSARRDVLVQMRDPGRSGESPSSEEGRVGNKWVITCRSRWWINQQKKKTK